MLESFAGVKFAIAARDTDAFAKPLPGRTDIVILVNRSATLATAERRHFQDFAKAGDGVIVLNQAMANYPDWPWYHSPAGGRYLDVAAGGMPGSGSRLQEQIIALPTGAHPITARLDGNPFHMLDETYRRMDIAADNLVLLRTRNSTADGPLLWVSRYAAARLVAILPGFDHGAHLNLAYRYLFEDAIAWVAKGEEYA